MSIDSARAADGAPKAGLELDNDTLNVPPEWETVYMAALQNLAMVYLI